MIELESIRFAYRGGGFELAIGKLHIQAGERAAIVGVSGSGKTTLASLISGILTVERGRLRVDGVELAGLSDAARRAFRLRRIGFVFQEFELLDYLSVEENVLLPYLLGKGLRLTEDARARAVMLAQSMGLGGKLPRRPGTLSQGERQRVAICRALVTAPALLIADEPTGNLDPEAARNIRDLLLTQAAERGATLVMVTHNHGLLEPFDQVIDIAGLNAGRGS